MHSSRTRPARTPSRPANALAAAAALAVAILLLTANTASAELLPPALTAQAGEDAIELRWDPVPGATRYRLLVWWASLPDWEPLAEVDAPATSYTHSDVTPGREYFYTIRAVDAGGQRSAWQRDYPSATVPETAPDSPQPSDSLSCAGTAAMPDPEPAGLAADCETLLGLKAELAGSVVLNWSTSLPISDWEGVTVENGRVTVLDLFLQGLAGSIPAELGKLTNLTHLNLSGNQLTGHIPSELGRLKNLRYLDLGYNDLTGTIPARLGSLTQLETLSLRVNKLTGHIPVKLETLTNLERLHLDQNQLTGTVPAWLARLTNLRMLGLFRNQLTGPIPVELASLTNLGTLDLSNNQLTGPIPVELGKLTNLQSLNLSTNQLTGTIPAELGKLTNLGTLYLDNNNLTGTIPPELDNLVAPTGRLYRVRIATGNPGLCGAIPPALHAFIPTSGPVANDLGSDSYPTGSLGPCSSGPPATPKITATVRAGTVDLNWDPVAGAVRYRLLVWWAGLSAWEALAEVDAPATVYTHEDVIPGRKQFYTIQAVNAAGERSAWQREYATATAPETTQPPAPRFPFTLVNAGYCSSHAAISFFNGYVRDVNNNPVNEVCVHIAFHGPRNTKCTGCGDGPGKWGFAPFGQQTGAGTTIEIYVVNCPPGVPRDRGLSGTASGPLSPISEKWTRTLSGGLTCSDITFRKN